MLLNRRIDIDVEELDLDGVGEEPDGFYILLNDTDLIHMDTETRTGFLLEGSDDVIDGFFVTQLTDEAAARIFHKLEGDT